MALPSFDQGGVLPPFFGAQPGNPAAQTPYRASFDELVERFCTSRDRALLLHGLALFRHALTAAGIIAGFQWIDGSFVEHAEITKGRSPGDIDVVTLLRRPATATGDDAWAQAIFPLLGPLLDPAHCKATFSCDAYFVDLDADPEGVADQVAYWFGLFSHQRDTFRWKGIVQVPLGTDDRAARAEIARRMAQWPLN